MTFEAQSAPDQAFVWLWPPGSVEPVVAGRIDRHGLIYSFTYGARYLARREAVALYEPELPLVRGAAEPTPPLTMHNCLRDGAPDAWGRRVIINQLTGLGGEAASKVVFDELTFLLNSGSDRIGALDFQASAEVYTPREAVAASLDDLLDAAGRVERGDPIPPTLGAALFHGSAIGGARPKALIDEGARKSIAKFSTSSDTYAVVKAEFVAMRLAKRVGLAVASVRLATAAGKDVLLVERFDREPAPGGWTRRAMVSGLTLLRLDEMLARYASYGDLADVIRARFAQAPATLRELFGRMVFNILCGNTDDHARNHAAFWDGERLNLTPAYDICPQARTGGEAGQAMLIDGPDRRSQLETCRRAAPRFLLADAEAQAIIEAQVATVRAAWPEVCDEARLSQADRRFLWGRQFLNPYAFEG